MSHHKRVVPGQPPHRVKLGQAKSPFVHHHGRGHVDAKDYTKFIRWTPRNVAIAVLLLGVPYVAVVTAVAKTLSWMAALPFLVLLVVLGVFIAALYGLSRMSL
jgi:hypothetical protein